MDKTSMVLKLTKAAVDRAAPVTTADGKTRQRVYWDTELKGFGVNVGAKAKTFFAQRRVRGRQVRVTIGRYGPYTVDQARDQALGILATMSKGVDPNAVKREQAAAGITLSEAVDLLTATAENKGRSPRTVKGYRNAIELYLEDWLNRPLAGIARAEVHAKHRKIAKDVAAGKYAKVKSRKGKVVKYKRGPEFGGYTANGVMRAFRAAYNRALRQHAELPANPCIAIDWFKEERRQTVIPTDKLADWHKGMMKLANGIKRDHLLFLLFTGLRRGSAAEITWDHVDFEDKKLHIPNPKGGKERAFDLPLPDHLIELLKRRQQENEKLFEERVLEKSDWVFPAASQSGHIEEPKLKFKDNEMRWTPHDLRRTFITVAESLDISPYAIKLLVNHSLPRADVTGGYVVSDVERLRAPMEAITNKLLTLCNPEGEEKVVRLPAKKRRRAAK